MKGKTGIFRIATGVCLLLSFCLCLPASAQLFGKDDEDDTVKKEWEVELPPFPEEANLLFFYVSPIQTQKFAIDETSLVVGESEIRYTLVAISPSGVKNITYEGMQCNGGKYRRYAFGRFDNTWSLSRRDEWRDIHFLDANRPQASLALNFFCQGKSIAGAPKDMLFKIRHNRSLQEDKWGR